MVRYTAPMSSAGATRAADPPEFDAWMRGAEDRYLSDLTFAEAQQVMWMLTSRDVYRMLVHDGGWSPAQYQAWLARTLVESLVQRG